uniref:hypothetical protein n=1 Tax=Gelidibacter sp. TaxID=2018083 RepID=UPI0040497737
MKKLLLIIIGFTASNLFSQTPVIEWQKNIGGSSNDFSRSVKQTSDGGFILAGSSASINGDLTNNNGGEDFWIVKLNSLGNIQWQKSIGGSATDIAYSISQTTDGGYIVCGMTGSNSGNVTGNHGMSDGWVVKLNSIGNIQWQKALGGTQQESLHSIQQTSDGGYITAGFSQSSNGDVSNNNGSTDYWIVKLNSSGNILWEKSIGGSGSDTAYSISQTTDDGYIVTGSSNSNDGDVIGNHGFSDSWTIKLDSSGTVQWKKSFGGTGVDIGNSIQQTIDGGYVLAGVSTSNDGDVSGNHGNGDFLIIKLDSTGNIQWQKSLGGTSSETARSIYQTEDTGYLIGGEASSNNGDVSGGHGNNNDYWVVKLDNGGNIQWQKCLGGTGSDRGMAIDVTTDGKAIITGYSQSSDGDLTGNYGVSDWWTVKLSCITPSLDLYIKDSNDDIGVEPNATMQNMWSSEDIWVRNDNDNGLTHQNPEYKSNNQPNYISVRVINNSCVYSVGNETLTVNWAKANTALSWPQNWNGSLQNGDGYPLGGVLPSVTIPMIPPGGESIIKIPWIVPNPNNYLDNDNPWHFCLIARIDSTIDPLSSPYTTNPNIMVRNNNNQAWKNITIVDVVNEGIVGGVVGVGNIYNQSKKFKLDFMLDDAEIGKPLFEEAEIAIEMDDVLYDIWVAGGEISNNIRKTKNPKKIIVTGDNASLGNLLFAPQNMGRLYLTFNFLTKEMTSKTKYVYHVVQKDVEDNIVVGGETYVIKKNDRLVFNADAGDDHEIDINETITITAADISEPAIYNWYDNEGSLIYQGKDLTVTNNVTQKYKLEIIALSDGFKDYVEVEVKVKPNVIESITPNPASNNLVVNYITNGVNSAYLMLIGDYGGGTSNNYILDTTLNSISINISNYPSGYYIVALVCEGQIVDAKNLIKQ